MNLLQEVQQLAIPKGKIPEIKIGNNVKVHQKIKEGEKERIQIFEGLVIAINSGHGADKTITVRKIIGGIGVEKIFTVYSKSIEKIVVEKQSKVRRAKLYYMRDRRGKSARLKQTFIKDKDLEASIEELAAQKAKEEAELGVTEAKKVTEDTAPVATTEAPVTATETPVEESAKPEAKKE